jgi:aminoglycoside phosphotransferase (APT) family kinase protein
VVLELGEAVARLHRLEAPAVVASQEALGRLRGEAPERLRRFGFPSVLADQVADYLEEALPADTLVHGDLTGDHVFVRDSAIEGIIDWGDAMVADPYYELVPLFFDAFGARRDRLRSFLDAYGWRASGAEFARRALRAILSFQFDTVAVMQTVVGLDRVRDLGELAERLFARVG